LPVKYEQWDELDREGAFVHVPDVEPAQVSHLAKAYVRKRLGPEAKVVTASTPRGTFVAVAYLPTVVATPEPRTQAPEPPAKTKRQQEQEQRAEQRARLAAEKEVENRKLAVAGRRNVLKDVKGLAAWSPGMSSEEKAAREDRWARAKEAGASEAELEDILNGEDGDDDEEA